MLSHLKINHKWSSKDLNKLKYECSQCNVAFFNKEDLETHITKIHENIFNCSFCGIVFRKYIKLKVHIDYTHKGKKKEQCQICNVEFEKSYLDKHIAVVHEGKKPYLCSVCGYKSATATEIKVIYTY